MASSSPFGRADDRLNSRSWRRSDPQDADSAFSFLRQPLPSIPVNPSPNSGSSSSNGGGGDSRAIHAHRRFTSSFASPFGYSRRAFEEPPVPDIPAAFKQALSPGDKKKAEYEFLMQKKLDRQKQFEQLSKDRARDEVDLQRLQDELGFVSLNGAGHQSEPTTPPEYGDTNGFPSALSRPNRFSTSSLMSSTGIFGSRKTPADSAKLASPPSERARAYNALTGGSGPQSRQNSDEEDSYDDVLGFERRSNMLANRNSMPVTRRDLSSHNGRTDSPSLLDQVNTHAFLFGDEDKHEASSNAISERPTTRSRPLSLVHMDEDGFPSLLRQQTNENSDMSNGNIDSATSNGASAAKRASYRRSLPQPFNSNSDDSPAFNFSSSTMLSGSGQVTPTKAHNSNRHSMGAAQDGSYQFNSHQAQRSSTIGSPPVMSPGSEPPKLQSSYSTNDIPTMKNANGGTYGQVPATTAEQRLHQHNASLGRIPHSVMSSKRHSRDISNGLDLKQDEGPLYAGMHTPGKGTHSSASSTRTSTTHPSATMAPATPSHSSSAVASPESSSKNSATSPFPTLSQYSGYNQSGMSGYGMAQAQQSMPAGVQNTMNMLTASMNSLAAQQQQSWTPNTALYSQQFHPSAFGSSNFGQAFSSPPPRFPEPRSHSSSVSRRNHGNSDASDTSRFANIPLESLRGEIYSLCKDQHGCRFLQKKLEERNDSYTEIIFQETKGYMVELMTDPFGNYLCQKLLEFTNDDQRTALINNAAPHMVNIALNQHGTRALQKMIEYVLTQEQADTLINALQDHVVPMIQDLNGNHVIQKCLNRLSAENVQFIISAVSDNCVVVGTHRHGCCVIQRCIDHATGEQKNQLIGAITNCSFPLVQDPFGNYVLQYIFDQNDDTYSQLLCRTFVGHITNLSKQKFSSNVIEKCIRIADTDNRHAMIEEIILSPEFDRLADDPFANYVIQTAWLHAAADDEVRLAERMRPILHRLRHKPHGRRFQTRLTETERRHPEIVPNAFNPPAETGNVLQGQQTGLNPQNGMYQQQPDQPFGGGFRQFHPNGHQNGNTNGYRGNFAGRQAAPGPGNLQHTQMSNMGGFPNHQQYGGYQNMHGMAPAGAAHPWSNGMYGQQSQQF